MCNELLIVATVWQTQYQRRNEIVGDTTDENTATDDA